MRKAQPCTVERVGQPAAKSALAQGRRAGVGKALFLTWCGGNVGADKVGNAFVAPDAPAEEVVDPAEVAQEAVDKMLLAPPRIEMSPKPGGKGLIGMPVWLAVDKSSKTRFGPTTASASAGDVTVTATARVTRVDWNLGDGGSRSCTPGQMKPYKKSYGMAMSECGYRYRSLPPNAVDGRGTYTVSATSHWDVEWQVEGSQESGELDQTRSSQVDVSIGEARALH
ncbi:ATP/GTP-binding protein [Streptomyces cacaoi]|uniref:ATP/GTP-binding protein n=1 Tax=Streptomyces cacaoi TaxID=1898 RepID=UPI001FD06A2D|nr:ATP/GTP-binding protein [Streptomyces cacaoi]